jgi:hypothetical protein
VAPEGQDAVAGNSAAIDAAVGRWRQGDCVLGPLWFAFRIDPALALTEAARVAAQSAVDLAEEEVDGFVVVTQTCDVVRSCQARPFVEICPLVEVTTDILQDIKRLRRPNYAFIPALEGQRLVADLDRVMTVEKSVVARWTRIPGWASDAESRSFSQALARKRVRFAFPDDFVALVRPLQNRLTGKHGKDSPEGRALRALSEIRVTASPSWADESVSVMLHFIRHENGMTFEGKRWYEFLESWLSLVPAAGRFHEVQGLVTTLDNLTAAEYVRSDRLDLDHLSASRG